MPLQLHHLQVLLHQWKAVLVTQTCHQLYITLLLWISFRTVLEHLHHTSLLLWCLRMFHSILQHNQVIWKPLPVKTQCCMRTWLIPVTHQLNIRQQFHQPMSRYQSQHLKSTCRCSFWITVCQLGPYSLSIHCRLLWQPAL